MTTNNNIKSKVFTMRINEILFEKIRTLADQNKRSIAKEIEFRLEKSIKETK